MGRKAALGDGKVKGGLSLTPMMSPEILVRGWTADVYPPTYLVATDALGR